MVFSSWVFFLIRTHWPVCIHSMFWKLRRVIVPISQVYCRISVLNIFVSVHVMSKSIVYFLVIAEFSPDIPSLLCVSVDLLSILAISTSRNLWHFLPHSRWPNSFDCSSLPLLLNEFGVYHIIPGVQCSRSDFSLVQGLISSLKVVYAIFGTPKTYNYDKWKFIR